MALLKKKVTPVPFKMTLIIDKPLLDRIESVRQLVAAQGFDLNLEGAVVESIATQTTRAEKVLAKVQQDRQGAG